MQPHINIAPNSCLPKLNHFGVFLLCFIFLASCKPKEKPKPIAQAAVPVCKTISCESNLPKRFASASAAPAVSKIEMFKASDKGMVLIPAGTYMMGADNKQAYPDEYPKHKVTVNTFWMDQTEVTNKQFAQFVAATHYVTTAERKPDWQEMKKQVAPGTPEPDASLMVPASLVFMPPAHAVPLDNVAQWWLWKTDANWRHPHGPGSDIKGKENYPVVQVSWFDAVAYCKWAHKRLPTEAEWEWAARGGLTNNIYPWGNESVTTGKLKANIWQGHFPDKNTMDDKFYYLAPVGSFQQNGYGLFDMAGNAWEWCNDLYNNKYYSTVNSPQGIKNPRGPNKSYDPDEPYASKRVTRGGSFLCNDSYCSGYRVARRMKSTDDSSLENLGFRCVRDDKPAISAQVRL